MNSINIKWISMVSVILFLCQITYAQNADNIVSGVVSNIENGESLPGVNVTVKGTTTGTTTGLDGRYRLQVSSLQDTLIFSFIGFERREIPINGRTEINIEMKPIVISGEEMIVVGYTSQQRKKVSDAVSNIKGDEIDDLQVSSLGDALKGKLAGVSIVGTGEPGSLPRINIRGASFIGNNSPLFVIDGMYTSQNPNINPNEIESIEFLKDASAAAQYGAQAANGVVVITTKKGSRKKMDITVNSSFGVQEIPKKIPMMDAQQWSQIATSAYENAGLTPPEGVVNPQFNTDWQDAFFESGSIQDHNMTISGGNDQHNYMVSGGYLKQDGAVVGPQFKRYSLRVNTEFKKGIFTFGESLSFSKTENDVMVGFPFIDVVRMLPSIPVRDESNESGFGFGDPQNPTFGTNPIGLQKMEDNEQNTNQIIGSLYTRVQLRDNLQYKFNFGLQYDDNVGEIFRKEGIIRFNNPRVPANLTETRSNFSSLLIEHTLTFEENFGLHNITSVNGFTIQKQDFEEVTAFRESFANESINTINAGTDNLNNSGFRESNNLQSFFTRLNYDYDGKYLLSGTYRLDGSSRFSNKFRYGNFYAASGGWVLSEENFLESIFSDNGTFNFLKLRGSFGELGSQDIGNFQFSALIQRNISYIIGDDRIAPGAIQTNLANPNIKWQENQQFDIGADLILLDNKLSITYDYYRSESEDLLVQAPLPILLGSQTSPFVNAGSIRNKGSEFLISYQHTFDKINFNVSGNLTTIDNKVLSLGNDDQPLFAGPNGISRTAVGDAIGSFFLLSTDGIFQNEQEIISHGAQPNAKPGDIRFKDLNDDGLINDEDRSVVGNPFADVEYGINFDVSYKSLDLSASFRGIHGNQIYNMPKFFTDRMDDLGAFRTSLDPWTPTNTNTDDPRAVFGAEGAMNANPISDRWIENGSFFRLQNLEIGYTLPARLLDKMGFTQGRIRVYASGRNLFTITGYSNWDPEIAGQSALARGIDDARTFPNVRTGSIGININY